MLKMCVAPAQNILKGQITAMSEYLVLLKLVRHEDESLSTKNIGTDTCFVIRKHLLSARHTNITDKEVKN